VKRLVLSADRLRPGDVAVLPLARVLVAAVKRHGNRVTLITSGGLPVDLGRDDDVTVLR